MATINVTSMLVIILEANDEVKSETIDFSDKLYGVYQYTFNGIEDVVTINHLGQNLTELCFFYFSELSPLLLQYQLQFAR